MNEPLSPSAQAVYNAVLEICPAPADEIATAALRAAADQVLPEEPLHGGDQRWMYERDTRQESRKKFLTIAAELEAQ